MSTIKNSHRRFEVYLNRRAMGKSPQRIYSIRDAAKGIVTWSNKWVLLADVEMVVQNSGREDTLRRLRSNEKITRTVHSFLRGTLLNRGRNAINVARSLGLYHDNVTAKCIGYDPTKSPNWLLLDDSKIPSCVDGLEPIYRSNYALMHDSGIIVF